MTDLHLETTMIKRSPRAFAETDFSGCDLTAPSVDDLRAIMADLESELHKHGFKVLKLFGEHQLLTTRLEDLILALDLATSASEGES